MVRDYRRYDRFLDRLAGDVYPAPPSEPSTTITRTVIERLLKDGVIGPAMAVLDVGCGQGVALELFRAAGLDAVGIALGADADRCRERGFTVYDLDQNSLPFDDEAFDFLWCRHVLEHSPAPLFTLSEYHRLTRPGRYAYVEVPAPDTSARHQENANHYSVFGHSAWMSLFARAGFQIARNQTINFELPCGPDTYWSFLLRRH